MVEFTYCKNFAHAETRSLEWSEFSRRVSKSVGYDTKEQSIRRAALVGGLRADESAGRADNIASRTIATLDYDDLPEGTGLDDIELALSIGLSCAFTAYTTFRHTPEAPRFRLFVPLSRAVSPTEYKSIVDDIHNAVGLDGMDACSYTINQIMFLASHRNGVHPWALSQDGEPWQVAGREAGQVVRLDTKEETFDLDIAVASMPLDLSPDAVAMLLESKPAEGLDYDAWLRVGMAIYHQTEGQGFDEWMRWSAKSSKHDPRYMRRKWQSFGGHANPVTMASIIAEAGGARSVSVSAESAVALSLEEEAEAVADRESYAAFKQRVQALNEVQLPPDIRGRLASIVHEVYARDEKMSLRDVKSSFKPMKKRTPASGGEETPGWLEPWVYAEADCVFVNSDVPEYAIKREAFRARFDRMPEPTALDTDAATFALNIAQIPTVVRPMYWPGQERLFETEGKTMINSYYPSGKEPATVLDEDGQRVVDLFMGHVRNTIDDEREGNLLIDFMAYVYRNPAHRVRWGMLLWGIEGNGKTYFWTIMQDLLGKNARTITTSMIERPFNDWAVGTRLVGIEEIRISGTNKWRILDQLKPMISNDTIAVEPKGATSYHAPNFASYLMTTNHQDAVPMSDNDRRYCVIFTRHLSERDLFAQHGGRDGVAAYFHTLFTETRQRIDAIGRFLLDWQISDDFDPHGRAPITRGITAMRAANVSDDRLAVEEAIEDYACDIVSERMVDVTHLNNCVTMEGGELPTKRALANVMRDLGYRQISGRRVKVKNNDHYVWVASNDTSADDEAREAVRAWHDKGDDDFSDVPF